MIIPLLLPLLLLISPPTYAQQLSQQPKESSNYRTLPNLRTQANIINSWRDERLKIVPDLLKEYDADVWIMSMLEYSEDTVFFSVKDATDFSARRRTLYLFHQNQISNLSNPIIWIDNTDKLWDELRSVLTLISPNTIALNIDGNQKFADGLHAGEFETLSTQLGLTWMEKIVRRPLLPVHFVSFRVGGSQLEIYKLMQETVWAMIEEAFSSRTIIPGKTTTDDIVWWFRDKMEELKVSTWFQPSVSRWSIDSGKLEIDSNVIVEGDMLHTDMGIFSMGLATDTQHLAYVLRKNETSPPISLQEGLNKSNKIQDLLKDNMKPGKTGNEILFQTRKQMEEENIEGLVYSHPIGDWGHSAGTLIGMTNLQKSVPINGDLPLLKDSWYSIELLASHFIPEWNRKQIFQQEEDVYWCEKTGKWEWVRGRQEKFWLIDSSEVKSEEKVVKGRFKIQL